MSVSPVKSLELQRAHAEGNAIDASNDLLTFGVGPEYGPRHTLVETRYLQKLREALARVEDLDQQARGQS